MNLVKIYFIIKSTFLEEFRTIDTNLIFKNIIYSEKFFSLNLNAFSFSLKNKSIIEKINLIIDIEGNNDLHDLAKNILQKNLVLM